MDSHTELTSAWKNLNQSKAALRHIENRLEAAVGSGVVLTQLDGEKNKPKRRGRRSQEDDHAEVKPRPQSRHSPDKSSRSPLRASTQDNAHRPASPLPDSSRGRPLYEYSLDLDSTRSSAVDATTVRVLNEPPGFEVSPGSARLERLRQRQTDEKLEKLKERIRRQREQLEAAAQRDRAQPLGIGAQQGVTAKVRKVAPAPPAPVYKGFNSSEIKIERPVEFSSNRDADKELTHHLTERGKHKPPERKITKPVRKIHRSASVPEPKPAISTSSWREGQKLVKMMLGPLPREPRAQSEDRERRTGAASRSRSAPQPESAPHTDIPARSQPSKATGSSRKRDASLTRSCRTAGGERRRETAGSQSSRPAEADRSHASNIDLLSADIRGILDDLQLEGGADQKEASRLSKRRMERSPSKPRPGSAERPLPRKRHYDADTVRLYIAKQQEERKKKQAEERRSQREEQERRSQRLHALYRKQREGVAKHKAPPPSSGPDPAAVKSRLQETYTKMLLEHTLQRAGPVYQPSGESDKENKRLEALSPSTSELSEHTPPPLYRTDLLAPPAGQFFSHLLSLEPECLVPPPQPRDSQTVSRLNRVEALKACAASLSSRIETEARRFVSNGGRSHGDDHGHAHRVKPLSPPERERPDTGSGFLNDTQELPGVGNLYGFSTREAWGEAMKPRPLSVTPNPALSYIRQDDGQESSGGSISEGPLSDGSLSDLTEDPDCCPVLNDGPAHNRIALFQKEAAHHSPHRPRVTSHAPWEELNKGSPHSVINIYTKNLQKYSNVLDLEAEHSPVLRSPLSAHGSANGMAYEDDFVSGSSSQSASRRSGNSLSMLSNGRSGSAAHEKREGERFPHSSTSSPLSSPSSAHSVTKRASERSSERSLVDGQRSASAFSSELQQSDQGKSDSPRGSRRSADSSSTLISVRSPHSSVLTEVPPFPRSPAGSPRAPDLSASSPSSARDSTPKAASSPGPAPSSVVFTSGPAHGSTDLQYTPAVLQQRLSAELNFLDVMEESVRQLSDVERIRAVSLAQQESVSLAQILKAQQQRQERELQLLQLKADQEALETQKQLQESKERAAQVHAELCESLVQAHQKALVELQESSSKMINQQAETAQHLREMTEMTRSQVISVTPGRQPHPQTDSEVSERMPSHTADTPNSSLTESEPSRRHTVSVRVSDEGCMERSSSVDEEVNTAQDDSLQTDKDSVSVDYSQRLDESVTEDELEKSFRSLLPSESHWRGSVERKRQSDEEQQQEKSSLKQDGSVPVFSGDQYSFSEFTMAMVKQYMQEEEVRSQHHSSLLRLRHRALKEKTRAELAWLELQKRHLRDKGEDDKMPPIRKKQRGLLLRLQQEQAEIRRLQEVNRAARRERKLLLKQQEEIERIQHTTLRLKEKLRNAGDTNQRLPVSGESEDLTPLTELEAESRSPSPLSVSGSETSSIMKKLKKMSYHTDERFLTQRELRLVHWRQQVEAELRRTDKEEPQRKGRVLTDRQLKKDDSSHTQQDGQTGRDVRSEDESSLVSSIHTLQECENTHTHGSPQAVSSSSKMTAHSSSRKTDLHSSAPTSEAASDQSDIEGRVLALRAELRQRKAEVQRLKKEQRVRQKERLKAQEASLLKQLESYNNFIEKTKAELSKVDNSASAKPQIKTPTSGIHTKPRAESPVIQRAEEESLRERSSSHQSESEISEKIHSESPGLSDEDPPTVTPTPVFGSPGHLSPLESERSSRTQAESVASSPRSEVTEEIPEDLSGSRSEQISETLLHLKVQETEEEEQPVLNDSSVLNKHSAEESKEEPIEELKEDVDGSHTPEESGRKEGEAEPSADVYNDDFESLGSSVQEGHRVSEDKSYKFSFSSEEEEEGVEEEEEEISVQSGDPQTDRTITLKDELPGFSVGDRVLVSKVQPGTLRFKGRTGFAEGFWAGVELDISEGSNDGTYGGISYFQCRDKHGIFAPPDKISHLEPEARPENTAEEDSSYDEELQNKKSVPSEEALEQVQDGSDNILNYLSQRNSINEAGEDPMKQEDQKPKPIDVLDLLVQSDSSKPDELPEAGGDQKVEGLSVLADTLIQSFVSDTLKQFQQIRKAKEEKISVANQLVFINDDEEQNEDHLPKISTRTDFHTFFDKDQDGASSPELCNRSESPVLGQEELAQRLAELELNREFLHVLSDEQDWFDEDFGLSSRKNAQQKSRVRPEEPPPSPPVKPPQTRRQQQQEEPAMLVPHKAPELEKLVSAALLEIWSSCKLDQGNQSLTSAAKPQPSETLLGSEEEEQCVRSYRQSVFDLAWELIQEVFAEDPNADRPQWIKPRRVNSSHIHRISNTTDLAKVQEFVSGEVLKIYGLRREQNHRTDWQKMLKFGRKKRDRVDHILVQELHEEEALWVNYDEDELFVKMQLADGILDTLLKDTVDVLLNIHQRRSKQAVS